MAMLRARECRAFIDAVVDKAEEMRVPVAIAVVNAAGYLMTLERMDDAGFITAQIAWGKAYTAVAFRAMSPQFPDGLVIQQWFKERNPQMMITLQSSPMAGSSPRAVARRCSRATSWSAHTAFRVARRIKTR